MGATKGFTFCNTDSNTIKIFGMTSNTTLKNYKTNTSSRTHVIPEENKYRKYKTEIRR